MGKDCKKQRLVVGPGRRDTRSGRGSGSSVASAKSQAKSESVKKTGGSLPALE
jgi:hypothetical protein